MGVRPLLPLGMLISAAALILYARLPVDGRYFWDLFPAFILSGVGLALAFVPRSIGALAGVKQSEAGVASGLIKIAFYVLAAVAAAGAVLALLAIESQPPRVEAARTERESEITLEAA